MPIYEYQCTACGHQLDALQKMSEAPLKDCPKCNQPALTKLVSAAGFQLKGSGWYVTDYSAKGKATQETSDKSSGQGSQAGVTETKPEIKPATKPEVKTDHSSSGSTGGAST